MEPNTHSVPRRATDSKQETTEKRTSCGRASKKTLEGWAMSKTHPGRDASQHDPHIQKEQIHAGEPPRITTCSTYPKRVGGPRTRCGDSGDNTAPREQDTKPEHMAALPGKQPEPGEGEKERGGVAPTKNINTRNPTERNRQQRRPSQ
ncbi:hypothetical protein NDU88_003381 [Pleurodeles waltl]|uniref:Uncharacterized protein n=1 Tax=Pleurodeles waltl TaxID=8319 RepID=A0AAV7NGI2_PLEWA|nr:hypothetical protein NDU88_003381 [Pleurodeles waltl]